MREIQPAQVRFGALWSDLLDWILDCVCRCVAEFAFIIIRIRSFDLIASFSLCAFRALCVDIIFICVVQSETNYYISNIYMY